MPTLETQRAKRGAVLSEIADTRFPYPSSDHPDWQCHVNFPDVQLGVELKSGGWIVPDIVVAEEPGHFIHALAVVALRHEVTEAEARERWLPLSKAGPLYLYVPAGLSGRAIALCRTHHVRLAGLRTWRTTARFGIEVNEAYSGPDLFAPIAKLLPPLLRPRPYRVTRQRVLESYLAPGPAQQARLPQPAEAERPALPAPAPAVAEAPEHAAPEGVHLPPPSLSPALLALGMILTGFGFIFPAELLGAGLTVTALGALGWLKEDVVEFAKGDHGHEPEPSAEPAAEQEAGPPPGVHLPPPSLSPALLALGMILTGFGFIFPAELLGAGVAMTTVGALRWLGEDIRDFAAHEASHAHDGEQQHA